MITERIEWVDIAKGIGIILVTIGHTRLSGTVVAVGLRNSICRNLADC